MSRSVLFFLFMTGSMLNVCFSQSTDFFIGSWDVVIIGTPNGDSKMIATLIRKEGKLTGSMQDSAKTVQMPLTNVVESADNIELFFTAQGYDVSISLNKIDNDNLKGSLLQMFETKAVRRKE